MPNIKSFDPRILLGDRLGLSLYGAFVEAYLAGSYTKEAGMYEKFIDFFPGERGVHSPETFVALIESTRRGGLDPYHPVAANPTEYALSEGSHRCSIAIQLGIDQVPYLLRHRDDRTDDSVFEKIFDDGELAFLKEKREQYIERCDALTVLKSRLRMHVRANVDSYQAAFSSKTKIPALRFYQGFEPLDLRGKRPSEKRVAIYNLRKHLRPSFRVLEPGCNVGFFGLVLSEYVKSVRGFEIDPNYIHVANRVADYCHIQTQFFSVDSVARFRTDETYDLVISTAVHGWADLPFGDYVRLIDSWTKSGGLILFESHEIDAEKDWREKKAFLLDRFDLLEQGFIDDVDDRIYESEMREFLLLKKHAA